MRNNFLQSFLLISPVILELCFKCKQEAAQCDKTRFSTIPASIDVTGIRNKNGSEKNDAIILVALVACTKFGVNRPKQTKVFIERKLNFYF